ncbi:collagen type XIX alpha 1 [Cricetulus griseus]
MNHETLTLPPHPYTCKMLIASKIFPKGLLEEYSVTVIFRVRRSTKKERWFLWQILNQQNMPQISIVIDGTKKVVEFMFRGAEGDLLNYVFKNRELRPLFDRQWHKLGIGVQSRVLSLYMDCNLIASRHTEEKASVDFHGKTVIAGRALDGKPVDVSVTVMLRVCFIIPKLKQNILSRVTSLGWRCSSLGREFA